jgi:hypothetical protein
MPHLHDNARQELIDSLQAIALKAQNTLNTAIPYLPDRTIANLIRLAITLGIPSISLVVWYYRQQLQQRRRQQQLRVDVQVLEEQGLEEHRPQEQR